MEVGGWLVVALVMGILVFMLVAPRSRRRVLWCPEREMLAEVEESGEAYAEDPGDRRVLFCSLWNSSQHPRCNRECLRRFNRTRF